MKAAFLALAFATAAPAPAQAFTSQYRILPNLYAEQYCRLRQIGVSRQEAINAAINENMVPGRPSQVTIDGKLYSVDVIESAAAVERLCPMYLSQ